MGYVSSAIIIQPTGLYKAIIRYSYLYFFTSEEHESFKTIGEAEQWLLEKRCYQLERQLEQQIKQDEKRKMKEELKEKAEEVADRQIKQLEQAVKEQTTYNPPKFKYKPPKRDCL